MIKPVPINHIIVGKMGSAYGIKGWIKMRSSTDDAESIFSYQPWLVKNRDTWQQIYIEKWKHYRHCFLIKLKSIEDRKTATILTNSEIIISSSLLPLLTNEEYYWKDILGCKVVTVCGYQLGKIVNLITTGSNDVLVIQDNIGLKDRLIPFIDKQVIKDVNLISRTITVEWYDEFN